MHRPQRPIPTPITLSVAGDYKRIISIRTMQLPAWFNYGHLSFVSE